MVNISTGGVVSIHAPVMDANGYDNDNIPNYGVSIHAPVMDAKIKGRFKEFQGLCFNPRARDGREDDL